MPETKEKGARSQGLMHDVVALWPSLPYLGYGVWLAWAFLAYSGTLWLSDTELNGENLSQLYVVSTASFAIVSLIAPLAPRRFSRLLEKRRVVVGAGLLAAFGCALVLAAGLYYFGQIMWTRPLFLAGAAVSGVATGVIALKCGILYGELPPRRVLLYAATSQIVVAFIYFAVIGSPFWAPVPGGPSYVGMIAFMLLPIAASLLLMLPNADSVSPEDRTPFRPAFSEDTRNLPGVFWRLVALSFVLPVVASMMRASVVDAHALAVTLEGNNMLMLLRVLMAAAFVAVAVRADAGHMNFGKLYSLIAISMVVAIACVPVFGAQSNEWSLLIYFASSVFEFVMWCLLAFVVFQKRISPLIVFGFGRGAFMLGSALGWLLGVYVLPQVAAGETAFAFYMICAGVVLVLSFVLFSERDFERLFSPIDENELSFENLMDVDLRERKKSEDRRGFFTSALDQLAEKHGLSAREAEVFRYLAMGRGSDYIADRLNVSWNTARSHTHNIYVKLGVHSRQDLIDVVDEAVRIWKEGACRKK